MPVSTIEEKRSILNLKERDRRWKVVREEMEKRGLECLIVWGSFGRFHHFGANIRYLSNLAQEGYIVFPLEHDPTLSLFLAGYYPEPWILDNQTGQPKHSKLISERLRELHLEKARIGIVEPTSYDVEMGFPHNTYVALTSNFPDAHFEDATDILEEARMIKSPAEVRCFELGCEAAEKVFQAVMDTAKPGVKNSEVKAVILDTLFRETGEPCPMLLYSHFSGAGREGFSMIPVWDERILGNGDIITFEVDASYLGYIAQFNHAFSLGEPDEEWQKIFDVAVECFNNGLSVLKPGITVGELNEVMLAPTKKAGYLKLNPTFHGLGLAIEEPFGSFHAQPSYQPNSARIIKPGMVLEFEPGGAVVDRTKGIGRGCSLGGPVLVTDTGCRLLSKTWKPGVKII